MPWTVALNREPVYPEVCPYCRKRPANTRIQVPHKQATGFYGVAATYQNYNFSTPACTECARTSKRLVVASVLMSVVPWAAWFALPFGTPDFAADWWETLALVPLALSAVGIGLFIWRGVRLRAVRVLHVGQDGVTWGFSNGDYARSFAEANQTTTEWKLLVVKLV